MVVGIVGERVHRGEVGPICHPDPGGRQRVRQGIPAFGHRCTGGVGEPGSVRAHCRLVLVHCRRVRQLCQRRTSRCIQVVHQVEVPPHTVVGEDDPGAVGGPGQGIPASRRQAAAVTPVRVDDTDGAIAEGNPIPCRRPLRPPAAGVDGNGIGVDVAQPRTAAHIRGALTEPVAPGPRQQVGRVPDGELAFVLQHDAAAVGRPVGLGHTGGIGGVVLRPAARQQSHRVVSVRVGHEEPRPLSVGGQWMAADCQHATGDGGGRGDEQQRQRNGDSAGPDVPHGHSPPESVRSRTTRTRVGAPGRGLSAMRPRQNP